MAVLLMVAIAGVVIGAQLLSTDAGARRELRKAAVRPIAELRDGDLARVIGNATASAPIAAALSGRPCIYYVVRVEARRRTIRSNNWETVIAEERGGPFTITDGSGRAIVDPEGARVSLVTEPLDDTSKVRIDAGLVAALFARHAHKELLPGPYRYVEGVIEQGELVAVLGSGVHEPDPTAAPAPEYRGAQPTVLHMSSTGRHPMIISDSREGTHYGLPRRKKS